MMRKFTSAIISIILIIALAVSASAAAPCTFLLQEYDIASEWIYCYGKQLPPGGKLSVSAGSQVVEKAVFSTLEQEKIPVTVYCLVESATSQSDDMKKQKQDLLLTFSSLMGQKDNMVLGLMDSAVIEGKPMDNKEVRDTAINTIEGQEWYTNLHDGINHAMKSLSTNTAYHTNRCLIVISDGHDDGNSKNKAEDVVAQIRESGIPVYTVVMGAYGITEKELAHQTEFAEASLGGFMSFPDKEGISASVAAQRIWESIKGATAIRIDTNELEERNADQQLLIRYDAGDIRYEDTILIRAVDLPVRETVATGEATEEHEESDIEKNEDSLVIVVACAIAAALIIAGVAAFVLLRKKPAQEEITVIPQDIIGRETEAGPPVDFQTGPTEPAGGIDFSEQTAPVQGRCHVSAVAIMHPEVSTDFYLTPNMETSFGRTNKADIILCGNDMKLSGIHGRFYWDGKMLLVKDMNSRNGTAVDGENCHQNVWLRLENGATLRAGNYEYRITFQSADLC